MPITVQVNLSIKEEYPRLCFAEMPVLERSLAGLNYETDTAFSVVIPLFYGSATPKYSAAGELLVHGFCKRAMWLAYEILNYTDFREQRWKLYVGATDSVRKILQPYLHACDFPNENILWLSGDVDMEYPSNFTKFPIMRAVFQQDLRINNLLSFDAAIYFVENQKNDIFSKMENVWTTEPFASFFPVWRTSPKGSPDYGNLDHTRQWYKHKLHPSAYYSKIAELIGISVEEFKSFWDRSQSTQMPAIEGRTLGFHRDVFASETFWDSIDSAKHFMLNDQAFASLFWHKRGALRGDIALPTDVGFYPPHPEPITHGNIGFLDSSRSKGKHARKDWIKKTTDIKTSPITRLAEGNWDREGYIIKRGLIPKSSCQKAVDFLFRDEEKRVYGQPETYQPFSGDEEVMNVIDYDPGTEVNVRKKGHKWRDRRIRQEDWVWQEIVNHPDVRETVNSLIGDVHEPNNPYAYKKIQGADLRGIYSVLPNSEGDRIHIDGHPFDCGVVVLLDDVEINGGCFSIYPGSHKLDFPKEDIDDNTQRQRLSEPLLFHGQRGDVIFWHPKLAHQEQPNTSENIRITLFHDWVKKK